MRILIADDVKEIRTLFSIILRRVFPTAQVDVVTNGVEAVDTFRAGHYDVVCLDILMPEKDGYQACLEIQDICKQDKRKIPLIIFCSGSTTPKEIKDLLADKTHYALLRKPMTVEQIVEIFKAVSR